MRITRNSTVQNLIPLANLTERRFLIRTFREIECNFLPHIASYFSDIPEVKYMSSIIHGFYI